MHFFVISRCKDGMVRSYNICKINCKTLLGNVFESMKCAFTVYKQRGFRAWQGYFLECFNNDDMTEYLKGCKRPDRTNFY